MNDTVYSEDFPSMKPCPFCGNSPTFRTVLEHYPAEGRHPAGKYESHHTIDCHTCGISMSDEYESLLVDAWNDRHISAKDISESVETVQRSAVLEALHDIADEVTTIRKRIG